MQGVSRHLLRGDLQSLPGDVHLRGHQVSVRQAAPPTHAEHDADRRTLLQESPREGQSALPETSINRLLKDLRKEIIALTDVFPFPNRGYGPLGNEDMQVYERFINNFKVAPGVTERSEFWKLSYTNSEQA